MDRLEYFLTAQNKYEWYKHKAWVLGVFTIKSWKEGIPKEPYGLGMKDGFFITRDEHSDEGIYILEKGKPIPVTKTLFDLKEEIKLPRMSLPNQPEPMTTTPAMVLINFYVLVYAFGKKFPFVNGRVNPNSIVKQVAARVKDNVPTRQRTETDDAIYVDEAVKFISAMTNLASFNPINSPSATPYTLTTSPDVKKLRTKLLEENKDRLNDPVVVADITKKLVEEDAKWLAQDPHGGFYVKKKTLDVARKKIHLINGLEYDMTGKPHLIAEPISDGLKLKNLPVLIDTLRDGSFSRGAMTALGGEAVKFLFRVFNSSSIEKEDCGTKLGIPIESDEKTLKNLMQRYVVVGGMTCIVNEKTIPNLIGKKLVLRTPGYCQADKEGRGFCLKCFGESFRGSERSLAMYGSAVASQMMYIFMKKMHGKSAASTKWNPTDTIS